MQTPTRALFLSLALLAPLSSCVVIRSDTDSEIEGKYVGTTTLEQITPGKDQQYVMALLGEPTHRTSLDDGTEIWRWSYSEKKRSSGHVLLLIDTDSSRESQHSAYVEFSGGQVVKAWRD